MLVTKDCGGQNREGQWSKNITPAPKLQALERKRSQNLKAENREFPSRTRDNEPPDKDNCGNK